jgi:hypothetical protein
MPGCCAKRKRSNVNAAETSIVSDGSRDRLSGGAQRKPSRLWLWFVAVFFLQLAAWGTWFVIASQHRVAEVPLAKAAGDER